MPQAHAETLFLSDSCGETRILLIFPGGLASPGRSRRSAPRSIVTTRRCLPSQPLIRTVEPRAKHLRLARRLTSPQAARILGTDLLTSDLEDEADRRRETVIHTSQNRRSAREG